MKTELQIAKDLWKERWNDEGDENEKMLRVVDTTSKMQNHKQTCQRFLDWFKDETNYLWTISNKEICELKEDKVNKRITDLKDAIKEYEDNGI